MFVITSLYNANSKTYSKDLIYQPNQNTLNKKVNNHSSTSVLLTLNNNTNS